jgi:hypothetical protein
MSEMTVVCLLFISILFISCLFLQEHFESYLANMGVVKRSPTAVAWTGLN